MLGERDSDDLLEGLSGGDREARARLLDWLVELGATQDEVRLAAAEDRLALLPLERRLGGRYTAHEIEERTGLPAGLMLHLRRLVGLPSAGPDDRVFGEDDVVQARSVQQFLDAGFEVEALSELTRILGESMARVASAVGAAFAATFLRAGDNELEAARRFDALAADLVPAIAPVLAGTFNAHMRESLHRAALGADALSTGQIPQATELAVCFADMVGFTRLGGELEVAELGSVASRLAALATDAAGGPVRLIKTIGDAAMLVSAEPEPLVEAALDLVAAAETAELPSLRVGIAWGEAVLRGGDYFGHPVNLASRVTGTARPGSVLCTQEVRDASPGLDWSFAGRFKLRGVAKPVSLHRARGVVS